MSFLSLTILIFTHIFCWLISGKNSLPNNPLKLSILLSGIHVIPHYFICTFFPESSSMFDYLGINFNRYFVEFGILYSLGFIFFSFSLIGSCNLNITFANNFKLASEYPYFKIGIFLIIAYSMFVIFYFYTLGGLFNYIGNFYNRSELRAGTGILDMFKFPFAYMAIMMIVLAFKDNENKSLVIFFILIIFMALVESLFGGRRNPIQFLLFGYLGYLMVNKNRSMISKSSFIITGIALIIFIGLLYFRNFISFQAATLGAESIEVSYLSYLLNFSYNDIYIYILSHFSESNFWYGIVYNDVFIKIASYFNGTIGPSPDEGLYIYNIYRGNLVEPPALLSEMWHNSWPPRTFGNGYMNFGIWGVFILFSIKGFITGISYKFMVQSKYNPFFMYLYLYMIFSFQISNLKIFELIMICISLVIISLPIKLLSLVKFYR